MKSNRIHTLLFVALLVTVAVAGTHGAPPAPAAVSRPPTAEASDGYGRTPLMLAAFKGDSAAVQGLLARGAAVNARDKNGMTALMWSAPETVPLLLKSRADVRIRDQFSRTALSYAAYQCDAAEVATLLDHGAAADPRDVDGWTPLFFPLSRESLVIGSSGPKHGGGVLTRLMGRECEHPERAALYLHREDPAAVVLLLLDPGADANARDNAGRSPLLVYVQDVFPLLPAAAASYLLTKGATVNAQDRWGKTALMGAALRGDAELVKLLLQHGAKVNATDAEGRTSLWYAAQTKYPGLVQLLKQAGAKE